ncbi:spore protease YyaC [Fredinandcohnia quinoae]|uniref:Spore protease YyaC n=1 Tax=Fredinandcohnia quinoae TaxID=2918902 RepID=A0AAW5E1H8_9BACI|nr:spore protease YyaC [Fredinandcohnia sp. SECRCQ15]MCH1626777.1 spore protease YyaC [Fredinandcohnia sp. SECRCQ15]
MNLKQNIFDLHKQNEFRIAYDHDLADHQVALKISSMLPSTDQPIIVVCIGTDRSTGDSLGPLIGTKITELGLSHFYVYGTLDEPIHAVNLNEKTEEIYSRHHNPFIIGIDACLGRLKSVGHITIGKGPIKPGAGVNKELIPIGDMYITGIVNVSGFMEFFVLQNTRLNLVMKIANTISNGIFKAEALHSRKQEMNKLLINKDITN